MQKNIHDYERIARVSGGLLLSSLAFWGPRNKWYLLSLVPVIEGLTGVCLFYKASGINTRNLGKKSVEEQANEYFPVESSSEEAAGHPIVGVS